MSRYLLLILLNAPFIIAAIVSAIVGFKLGTIPRRRFFFRISLWVIVFVGLILAEPLYDYLFNHKLTDTEPLSLFDVVQITGIVVVFYIATRTRAKLDTLERRVQDLHQELSIRLSTDRRQGK